MDRVANIMTVDVEEWYHPNYSSMEKHRDRPLESRVRTTTEVLLALLAEHRVQATLFFLGSVAEMHPALVLAAQTMGHEVASHGYAHQLVYRQTREEFRADVKKSLDILQDITGQPVRGYRAPSWSISKETPWAYEVLADLGLAYTASLFPFTTYLYGDRRAPVAPFVRHVNGHRLYEIPATVLEVGRLRIPFGGGFYLRVMPYWVTRLATWLTNRQGWPVVFYIHPHEIDLAQPRRNLPPRDYFAAYVNLATTLWKFQKVLSLGMTTSVSRYLEVSGKALSLRDGEGGLARAGDRVTEAGE